MQEEGEEMDDEEQELKEIEAMLLEEFPPVEDEVEEEETEANAEERLETEISQRFEKDNNNLTNMMVMMEACIMLKSQITSKVMILCMSINFSIIRKCFFCRNFLQRTKSPI